MLIEVNSYRRASFLQRMNYILAGQAISFLQSMPPSKELIFFWGQKVENLLRILDTVRRWTYYSSLGN